MQNTHNPEMLKRLHGSLVEIVSAMNRAGNDETLLEAAGVKLDRALLPLLVGVDRFGPINVGDLADRAGRDYTTVSRQLKKLKEMGLVARIYSEADQRVCIAEMTDEGRKVTRALDKARNRLAEGALGSWSESELSQLVTLLERLTADMRAPATSPPQEQSRHSP